MTPSRTSRPEERNGCPGDIIFKLYDTYGFPVDIVRDVVRDKHMTLDMDGFDAAMEGQRKDPDQLRLFQESVMHIAISRPRGSPQNF